MPETTRIQVRLEYLDGSSHPLFIPIQVGDFRPDVIELGGRKFFQMENPTAGPSNDYIEVVPEDVEEQLDEAFVKVGGYGTSGYYTTYRAA